MHLVTTTIDLFIYSSNIVVFKHKLSSKIKIKLYRHCCNFNNIHLKPTFSDI